MAESDARDPGASAVPAAGFRRTIALARGDRNRAGALRVSLGSGVFAFGVGLCIWSALEFAFANPYEIVSRITLASYPKQQDAFAYAIAIVSVSFGVVAGWFGWCAIAAMELRKASLAESPEPDDSRADASLARWSWPFAALLVALVPIVGARWGVGELVGLPLLAAGLTAGWQHFVGSAARAAALTPEEFSGQQEPARTSTSTSTSSWPPLPRAGGLRTILLCAVVPLLLYAWLYDGYLVHHRIDMHHEGEILGPWNALNAGSVPFRDIYVQHGLFQNLGKGWLAERLFDVSLASLRATEHLLGPLGHLALYLVGLALFRSWLSAVMLVFIASTANLWVIDRQALGLLAVAALARAVHRGPLASVSTAGSWPARLWEGRLEALSGVLTTLAFFYSAEVGLFTAAACGGYLALRLGFDAELRGRQRWLPSALYLGGAVACFLPFAVALASVGALADMFRNTWQQIAYQPTVWGRPFPPLLATLESVVSVGTAAEALYGKWFQWYLPSLIYLYAVGALCLRALRGRLWRRPESSALLLVVLVALCYFGSALSRADSFHVKFGSLLMWVLLGLALEDAVVRGWRAIRRSQAFGTGAVGGTRSRLRAVVWAAVACTAVCGYLVVVHDPIEKWSLRAETIASGKYWPRSARTRWPRLGGIRIGEAKTAHLREVVAYIRKQVPPGEPIFDFTSQPTYYFLANRPNPTRYALAAYAATGAMQREVIDDLERSATALVIYRSGGYLDRLDQVPTAKRSALIESYLRENYYQATQLGGTLILLRNAGDSDAQALGNTNPL